MRALRSDELHRLTHGRPRFCQDFPLCLSDELRAAILRSVGTSLARAGAKNRTKHRINVLAGAPGTGKTRMLTELRNITLSAAGAEENLPKVGLLLWTYSNTNMPCKQDLEARKFCMKQLLRRFHKGAFI